MNLFCSSMRLLLTGLVVLVAGTAFGQKPIVLEGHENVVSALAFSEDGKQLFSASWDRTVRVWETSSGRQEALLEGHTDWVFDLCLPGVSGKPGLRSASQNELLQWSPAFKKTAQQTSLGGATVNSAAFSPDGKWLAIGGRDGFVRVRSTEEDSAPIELGGFRSWVSDLCFTANGKVIAAGTRTGTVRILELPSGKERHRFEAHKGKQVLAMAISSDGKTLATGGFEQTARLWSLESGKQLAELSGHRGVVTAVAWSSDGRLLASGERHGSFHVWDTNDSNRQIVKTTAHSDGRLGFSVTALAFSADSKRIATGSYDKSIKIWSLPEK